MIQSRQQLIEEERKDPELSKIIQTLENPDSMSPEEFQISDNRAVSFQVTDTPFLCVKS